MAATYRAMILAQYGSLEAYKKHLNEVLDDFHVSYAEDVTRLTLQLKSDTTLYEKALVWTDAAIERRDRRTPRK